MNTLVELQNHYKFDTDKNSRHTYLKHYDELFYPLKDKKIKMLEIGVHTGGSIMLWNKYFKDCTVFGMDINYSMVTHPEIWEFDNVFFVGLEEGILPHSRSLMDQSELAEEVRLAYVGLTRARKRLFLTYTHGRRIFGNFQISTPSRILKVLPKDKLHLTGMAKEHFGEDDVIIEKIE